MRPIVMKPWGMEIWLINTNLYCYKMIICVHHKWSSNGMFHYHKVKDETFYVTKGKLELDIEDITHILNPQNIIRVKPFIRHRFRSVSNSCIFYEVSTHHDEKDSIRIP
jgi:mannose-6-phosphate isomerase-like protein (cupin superfamily)